MSDAPNEQDAAKEAAQNVVGEVTSWEYSAEPDTIGSKLDEGLQQAGVDVDDDERSRLVDEIDEVKQDESRGAPEVESAQPADDTDG
jgi:hypothetical protein